MAAFLATAALGGASVSASAAPVIVNGGFENKLAGWTVANLGSGGFFLQSGTNSPSGTAAVAQPPGGANAAMSDAGVGDDAGPGSHALYQGFAAVAGSATLSFDLYIDNLGGEFASPATLDWAFNNPGTGGTVNQQVRVDILSSMADPFGLDEVLLSVYASQPGDALQSGYSTVSADLSGLLAAQLGNTLYLRFAAVDNIPYLLVGIDNVRFGEGGGGDVPEPAGLLLAGTALGLLAFGRRRARGSAAALAAAATLAVPMAAQADSTPTVMLDPTLQVSADANVGLSQPIGLMFLGPRDYLVAEKASGQVKRVVNGAVTGIVLDLAVNSASERGLLSLVRAPGFPTVPYVYAYWTESSTGSDTTVLSEVPLRGNRVDRFVWNGSTLAFDRNVLNLRARQTDNVPVPGQSATSANPSERGNHNGGPMRFGPDGKLYVFVGDLGRRGWMQNLANGPFVTAPFLDDTFGGPAADNAHLSGVVIRLNADGTVPGDNPFFASGAAIGGEVGANLQLVYSYGHRNGFGMAFDPVVGSLWLTENGDDSYSELNRVVPGMNGGWIQLAGPLGRFADWRRIETTQFDRALQQVRYPPTRAPYTAAGALARMFQLPGATYVDPKLSWRYEIGPSGATFVQGSGLGAAYDGTLWFGSARAFVQVGGTGGSLYRLKLTSDRLDVDVSADPRLADRVADNLVRAQKFEGTESETLIVGRGFGTVTAMEQGPDGALYVVSLTDNTIYRISQSP